MHEHNSFEQPEVISGCPLLKSCFAPQRLRIFDSVAVGRVVQRIVAL
jgi:hypothetical protein